MTRLIIHVRGGVAQVTHATGPVEVLLYDWDAIEQGDSPDLIDITPCTNDEFEKELEDIRKQLKEAHAEGDE